MKKSKLEQAEILVNNSGDCYGATPQNTIWCQDCQFHQECNDAIKIIGDFDDPGAWADSPEHQKIMLDAANKHIEESRGTNA